MIWVLRTGSPWCVLSEKYRNQHTAYNNFRKWIKEGVIAKIFEVFSSNTEESIEIPIGTLIKKNTGILIGLIRTNVFMWNLKVLNRQGIIRL